MALSPTRRQWFRAAMFLNCWAYLRTFPLTILTVMDEAMMPSLFSAATNMLSVSTLDTRCVYLYMQCLIKMIKSSDPCSRKFPNTKCAFSTGRIPAFLSLWSFLLNST